MRRFRMAILLVTSLLSALPSLPSPAQTPSPSPGQPASPVETSPPAAATARGDTVAGKVVDARTHQPLAHALVTLQNLKLNRNAGSVYTGEDGRFRFPDLVPPGKYRMEGRASGHITAAYLQHGQLSSAVVTGAGLATDDLTLALVPAATISGRVVDENGEPVPHATVSLFRQAPDSDTRNPRQAGSKPASDEGDYEFGPLAPGRYFVVARGNPWYAVHPPKDPPGALHAYRVAVDSSLDVAYPTVFYPEARSADGASPIEITGGEQITANMRLEPEHAVALTVRRSPDAPNTIPPQLMEDIFGTELPVQTQTSIYDGTTTIVGLAPGRYSLREYTGGGNRLPVNDGTVDLTGGSVTRNAAPPASLASLTVTVRPAGSAPLPEQPQVFLSAQGQRMTVSSAVNEKGEADFQDVPPGEYRLRVAGARRPNMPLGSFMLNGKPASATHIVVGEGGHLSAVAQLSGSRVTVEGVAKRGDKPAAACLIVLVPASGETDADLFRRDQSDMDGSFSLPGVAPGRYLLIALEDAWSVPWTDVHALEPYLLHAQPLEVPAGSATTLQLPTPVAPQTLH